MKRSLAFFRKNLRFLWLGALPFLATACFHGHRTPAEKAKVWGERAADRFDMNEPQKAQTLALADQMAQLASELKQQHIKLQQQLQDQVRADKVDAAALTESMRVSLKRIDEQLPILTQKFAELHASLNTEQKQEFREMVDHMAKRWD